MDEVIEESGPVSGHLPRGHAFECAAPCTNKMCLNFDPKVLARQLETMLRTTWPMPLTVTVTRADGRRYRVHPCRRIRRLWNWFRGYRRPSP